VIGFDYTDRIAPAALKTAGCSVVFRYTTRPAWPKSITRAEVVELGAAAIPLVCNFESTADRMRGASAAGHADAVEQSGNLAALGIPPTAVRSWFSADWDVQPAEVADVLDYLHAAADVLGGKQFVGCYGGLRAVAAAASAGFAIWQTVAWSGGQWDPRAVARQTGEQRYVGSAQVDVNQIMNLAALGAWGGPSVGGISMSVIPATIGQKWPEIASEFPANAQYDDSGAIIWADGGARAAALYAKEARDAVLALTAKVGVPVPMDPNVLAAAIVAKLPAPGALDPATIAALAAAVETTLEQHNVGGASAAQLAAAFTAAAEALKGGA
jgi:hypothetical protein